MPLSEYASLLDDSLQVSKAFPAANANNNSDGLKIGGRLQRDKHGEVAVMLPAGLALVADKDITVHLEHSSDDGVADSYVDIPLLGSVVVTGIAGGGIPTTDGAGYEIDGAGNLWIFYPLPRGVESYVRANVAVEDAGGTLTTKEYLVAYVL